MLAVLPRIGTSLLTDAPAPPDPPMRTPKQLKLPRSAGWLLVVVGAGRGLRAADHRAGPRPGDGDRQRPDRGPLGPAARGGPARRHPFELLGGPGDAVRRQGRLARRPPPGDRLVAAAAARPRVPRRGRRRPPTSRSCAGPSSPPPGRLPADAGLGRHPQAVRPARADGGLRPAVRTLDRRTGASTSNGPGGATPSSGRRA